SRPPSPPRWHARGMSPEPAMTPAGVADLWLARLAGERHASPHTVAGYRRDLAKLLRYMTAEQMVSFESLDANRMRTFIAAEHRAGLAPKSLQRLLSSCRSLFRQLHREGLMTHDPLLGVRGPRCAANCRRCWMSTKPAPWSRSTAAANWRCATARCSSCSIPLACACPNWSACAGSTSTWKRARCASWARAARPAPCRAGHDSGELGVPRPRRRGDQPAHDPAAHEHAGAAAGPAEAHPPASAAPYLRQPHAGILRRPARGAGTAWPRRHRHHADLHPPGFPAPGQGLRRGAPAGKTQAVT